MSWLWVDGLAVYLAIGAASLMFVCAWDVLVARGRNLRRLALAEWAVLVTMIALGWPVVLWWWVKEVRAL
ncbi:hypothetical protein SAMN05421819_3541 [Bryocella elongata]|uniref:Uncharacterized protein n=1 Tax=Bryocella elongata TaxID=863522 RepID=A0A1H6B7F1_9BACT|nr:hypothetical protein [Bryocella elongata]SEG56056.1 hypothetical protein SAMN05421819_3541 [Bryocella elongata]